MGSQRDVPERAARCACGNLMVTARGEPLEVYLCSCTDCQRGSGSAFSYAAIFPESAVSIAGERRQYRQTLRRQLFLPDLWNGAVLFRAEGLPGALGVPVGYFDASLARPSKVFWGSRRHHWLELPASIALIETQPG